MGLGRERALPFPSSFFSRPPAFDDLCPGVGGGGEGLPYKNDGGFGTSWGVKPQKVHNRSFCGTFLCAYVYFRWRDAANEPKENMYLLLKEKIRELNSSTFKLFITDMT